MKNKIKILSASLLEALILTGCTFSIGNGESSSIQESASEQISSSVEVTPEKINSVEIRRVPVFTAPTDTVSTATMNVYHFNGSNVGYMEVSYLVPSMVARYSYSTAYDGYNYVITNTITNAKCVIDFLNQTFYYSNYDAYSVIEADYIPNHDVLISQGKSLFITSKSTSVYETGVDGYTVCTKDYNIPLYFDNGLGYLPIDLFIKFVTPFLGYTISYNGTSLYFCAMSNGGINSLKSFKSKGNIYTKEYMEYTYNLFALQLDHNYGLDCRDHRLGDSDKFKFLEGGAYEVLSSYHDGLTSLETNVADSTYLRFFADQLDDGGHTGFTGATCLCDENREDTYYGADLTNCFTIGDKLKAARAAAGYDPAALVDATYEIENSNADQWYSEIGNTAFITFDNFTTPSSTFSLPITVNNYWQNTIALTCYANAKIRSNPAIEHVVVDLSNNGGGESVAENFIASWLCNGVTTKTKNTIQGTYCEQTNYADVNLDGEYSEEDYLSPDIDVYCITSRSTFSCGNLLTYHLKELRNAKLIGGRSGGGSCMVGLSFPTGLGTTYQLSNQYQLGANSSTSLSNFVSVEDGLTPEYYPISYSDSEIANFYNRQALVNKINQN